MVPDKIASDKKIIDKIVSIIKKRKPENTEQLMGFLRKDSIDISEEELITILQVLEEEKKLNIRDLFFPISFKEYLFSTMAVWFWLILMLSFLAAFFSLVISEKTMPFLVFRSVIGVIYVLYLPGYVMVKTLYPINIVSKTSAQPMDPIERITLNVGVSIAVSSLLGLFLYNTPVGLNLSSITLGLLVLTVVLASISIWREYGERRQLFLRRVRKNKAYFKS